MRIGKDKLKVLIKDLLHEEFRSADGLYPTTRDLVMSDYKDKTRRYGALGENELTKYLNDEPRSMVQAFFQELNIFLVEETVGAPVSVARDGYDFSKAITDKESTKFDVLLGALGFFGGIFGGASKRLTKFRESCQKIAKKAEKQRDVGEIADLNLLVNKLGSGAMVGSKDADRFGHLNDADLEIISENSSFLHSLEKAIYETMKNLDNLKYIKSAITSPKLRTRKVAPQRIQRIQASANFLNIDSKSVALGVGFMRSISKFQGLIKRVDNDTIKKIHDDSARFALNVMKAQSALENVTKGVVNVTDMKALKEFNNKIKQAGGLKVFKLPTKRVKRRIVIDWDSAGISKDVANLYESVPEGIRGVQGYLGGDAIMVFPPIPKKYLIPENVDSPEGLKNCIGFFAECLEQIEVKDAIKNASGSVVEIIRQPSHY